MDIALIVTIAIAAVGATWTLRSKLGAVENTLLVGFEKVEQKHKALEGRVIKLEGRRIKR